MLGDDVDMRQIDNMGGVENENNEEILIGFAEGKKRQRFTTHEETHSTHMVKNPENLLSTVANKSVDLS